MYEALYAQNKGLLVTMARRYARLWPRGKV